MLNVLKPSGAKATGSFNQQFQRSRLILTVIYTLILAGILLISSSVITSVFFNRLDRRFERLGERANVRLDRAGVVPPRSADVRADFLETIYLVNGILLLIAAILSYWLAGVTLRPIQVAYHRQRQFLSDISHELRTPLAILQTNLENDLSATKTEDRKRVVGSHLEEVGHMSALIRDLLTLSRLHDESQASQAKLKADLRTIVAKAVERLVPIADKHQIKLGLTPLPNAPLNILMTNDDLLLQALTNLIQNAVVYNKPEGQVTITARQQDKAAIVIVEDTGVGISKEDQAKIFDRFYRVDKSRSRQTGGSGLGLSIVKSIIDALGGTIVISSEVGQGTKITLSLPIQA